MVFLVLLLFFSSIICATNQFDFGKLEIVSDLLPEFCFVKDLNYIQANPEDGLPRCDSFPNNTDGVGDCAKYRAPPDSTDDGMQIVSIPSCSKDGQFAPVQCKGQRATGRCFCFSSKGKRLFGQSWWKDADDMTCACSRRKAEMEAKPNPLYFNSLHCNSIGNYEPLQCDVVNGHCWCADEKIGDLTSPVVPDGAMVKLPCYKSINVGTRYLRQCESQKYAQEKILYQLKLRGTLQANFEELLCDDDGTYGAYKVVDGSAYCVWKDNSNLGSWQYAGNNRRTTLNCNCARDTRIYKDAGKTQTLKCAGNGNYEAMQTAGEVTYCVDADGYRKTQTTQNIEKEEDCADVPEY